MEALMIKATVAGLDRDTHTARCVTDDGATIDAAWLGSPPPPSATVMLEDVGRSWVVVGTVGDVRTLLVDDFLAVHTHAAGTVGDAVWSPKEVNGGTVTSADADPPPPTAGAARLTADYQAAATSYSRIRKRDQHLVASPDHAVWTAARVAVNDQVLAGTGGISEIGWATNAYIDSNTSNEEGIWWTVSGAALFASAQRSTGWTYDYTDIDWTADEYHWLDLVFVGGGFVAVWVDGTLTLTLSQWEEGGGFGGVVDIPTDTDAGMTLFARQRCASASNEGRLDIDRIEAHLITPATDNVALLDAVE